MIPQGDTRLLNDPIAQHMLAMTRIALRPGWVGVLDFQTRFPGGLVTAGLAPEDGS